MKFEELFDRLSSKPIRNKWAILLLLYKLSNSGTKKSEDMLPLVRNRSYHEFVDPNLYVINSHR